MKSRGFTLLEILIVLTILLVGLSALSTLLGSAMRQAVEAEEKTSIQMICQNRLNRILSGEETVLPDESQEIDRFNQWNMTVHLDDAPLSELVRIRIVAQKYEKTREPSADRPGVYVESSVPILGQHLIVAQWARRSAIEVEKPAGSDVIGSLATPLSANGGADPFAAAGFPTGGVVLPPESETPNAGTGGVSGGLLNSTPEKIGGDALSESLLERARSRRKGGSE